MSHRENAPNRFELRRLRNRAALLEASIELFQRQGIRATKLEDICERADVSPRTFFNHFETREHLVRAIARQRTEQMAGLLDASADDPRPIGERLAALLAEMAEYLSARPAYRELVGEMLALNPEQGSEIARQGELGRAVLRFVQSGLERGEVSRRHPPAVLADLLLGAITTALANWCADERYDLDGSLGRTARVLVDLFSLDPSPDPVSTGESS